MKTSNILERVAKFAIHFTGTTTAFIGAILIIVIWLCTGPIFNFNDTWQLVINTGTTIVTFLMVFLIQRAQNKDSQAVHLKLNELIASLKGPSNRLVAAEDFSEVELITLGKYFKKLAEMAKDQINVSDSHSIDEAILRHETKYTEPDNINNSVGEDKL